jgi:hypothetical protein
MPTLELKPTHKPVQHYCAALRQFDDLGVRPETAVGSTFHDLPRQVISVSFGGARGVKTFPHGHDPQAQPAAS